MVGVWQRLEFEVADPAAPITKTAVILGGTSSTNPEIYSTANIQIDGSHGSTNAGSGYGVVMSYGGYTQIVAAPIGSGTPGVGYVQIGGSSGDVYGHLTCLGGTNTSCFFAANGTGAVTFANSSGNLATYNNSAANTAGAALSLRAASSTQPVLLQTATGSQSANIAAGGTGGVMTALATNATLGLFGIPTVAGTPTGVPVDSGSGAAFVVYNTTSHSLNIYDGTAGSWYHVALTAGGG